MNKNIKYNRKFIQFLDSLPNRFKVFKEKYFRRLLFFLVFVFLSSIFWFIRALNENYSANIYVPIKYSHYPENKFIVGKPIRKIKLRVRGFGYKILGYKLKPLVRAINIPVADYAKQYNTADTSYIELNEYKGLLEEEFDDFNIESIHPDTIFFRLTEILTKKVPVIPVVEEPENLLMRQFMLNGEIFSTPDSIIITGPQYVVENLYKVFTEPIDAFELKDTLILTASLNKVDDIQFSLNKVKVIIPVDKYTETSASAKINTINVPDSMLLKTFPNNVTLKYRITLSRYNKLNEDDFFVYVDYKEIDDLVSSKIKVHMLDTPSYIKSLTISPSVVEFLKKKND